MAEHLTPVRRQIVVPTGPAVAFDAFTADIAAWWPLDGFSVFGAKNTVAFVDGELVETSPDGRSVWGSVLEWAPPRRLRITWHPGTDPGRATEVAVRFDEIGDGSRTLVTLEHTGWERLADPFGTRGEYAGGWRTVLGRFGERWPADDPSDHGDVWLALSHTPGPDAPADKDVFSDPRLREHFSFVSGLLADGVLVAAGPIEGRTGHGMTVVRVAAAEAADLVRRAQNDDQSVAGGLLDVDIAVWAVALAADPGGPTTERVT
jgi:uncharacterized protein YndB with AHSA1/START domain